MTVIFSAKVKFENFYFEKIRFLGVKKPKETETDKIKTEKGTGWMNVLTLKVEVFEEDKNFDFFL